MTDEPKLKNRVLNLIIEIGTDEYNSAFIEIPINNSQQKQIKSFLRYNGGN